MGEPRDDEGLRAELLSPAEEWTYSGEWYSGFGSSNVRAIAYDRQGQKLTVEYGKAGEPSTFWEYEPIPPGLAQDLYGAPSKGVWLWDHVRVRGTVHSHQVDAALLSGPSGRLPGWFGARG